MAEYAESYAQTTNVGVWVTRGSLSVVSVVRYHSMMLQRQRPSVILLRCTEEARHPAHHFCQLYPALSLSFVHRPCTPHLPSSQVGTEIRPLSPASSISEPAAAGLLGPKEIEALVQSAINNGALEAALNAALLQVIDQSSPSCLFCSSVTVAPAESLQVSIGHHAWLDRSK